MSQNNIPPAGNSGRSQRPMFDQEHGAGAGGPTPGVPRVRHEDAFATGQRPAAGQKTVYRRAGGTPPKRTTPGTSHRAAGSKAPPPQRQNAAQRKAELAGMDAAARQKAKKKRRQKRIGSILMVLLIIVVSAAGLIKIIIDRGNTEFKTTPGNTPVPIIPSEVSTVTIPEYTGKGIICGLVLGISYDNEDADGFSNPNDKVGPSDMLMYVMYDTVNNKANILQIPRDVYVGDAVATGGTGKINGLYPNAARPEDRVRAVAEVLYDQLKLPTDFYVTLDMDAVKELVDAVGGIEVFVPRDLVDKENPNNVIKQGWTMITGESAEFLLRNRNFGDQDLTRLQIQQSFYSALFREMKLLTATDMVMWMKIILHYSVVGGIDVVQIGGLAQKALTIDGSRITFVRPPVWGVRYQGYDLVSLEPNETAELLNTYFRPDGHTVSVEEMDIQDLAKYEIYGLSPSNIRTMADVQETETPKE